MTYGARSFLKGAATLTAFGLFKHYPTLHKISQSPVAFDFKNKHTQEPFKHIQATWDHATPNSHFPFQLSFEKDSDSDARAENIKPTPRR